MKDGGSSSNDSFILSFFLSFSYSYSFLFFFHFPSQNINSFGIVPYCVSCRFTTQLSDTLVDLLNAPT